MTDHEARARKLWDEAVIAMDDSYLDETKDPIAVISQALREAEEAERAQALNEAEKTEIMLRASIAKKNSYICDLELAIETRDARIADLEATVARAFLRCQELEEALGEIYRLTEYLCHADPVPGGETSSAEGPHQTGDGEAQ